MINLFGASFIFIKLYYFKASNIKNKKICVGIEFNLVSILHFIYFLLLIELLVDIY